MSGDRVRGLVLCLSAALLLAGGATWWWLAAPRQPVDAEIQAWRQAAEQALPEVEGSVLTETVALSGDGYERADPVDAQGEFLVSVFCVGHDGSRTRVRLGGEQWGRTVPCSGDRTPQVFRTGAFTEIRLRIDVDGPDPVVFRYKLERAD